MYVGSKSESPKQKQFLSALIIFLVIWLLLASILDKSPARMIMDGWDFMVDSEKNEWQKHRKGNCTKEAESRTIAPGNQSPGEKGRLN